MSKFKWESKRAINAAFIELQKMGQSTAKDRPYTINGIQWTFNTEQREKFQELINSFISYHGFSKYFKSGTIHKAFMDIYSRFISENKIIEDEILHLATKLKETIEHKHTFIFKVKLLETDMPYTFDNIFIGDANFADDDGESLADYTLKFLDNLNNENPGKDEFINFIHNTVQDTVITVKEVGDEEFSKERAIETARNFLNEIAFFSNITYFYKTQPCLEIDNPNDSNFIKINQHNSLISYGSIEPELAFPIFFTLDETIDYGNDCINKFAGALKHYNFPIFQNGKDNEILTRISTAINWYVDALQSKNNHTKFLFCCIGLESIYSINQSSPITESLSDNCAFLLGNSLQDRITIKSDVKKLYGHRSGVAHGRKPEILDKDLKLVFEYLKYSIINLLELEKEKQLKDDKSLLAYFENQKLDSSTFLRSSENSTS